MKPLTKKKWEIPQNSLYVKSTHALPLRGFCFSFFGMGEMGIRKEEKREKNGQRRKEGKVATFSLNTFIALRFV